MLAKPIRKPGTQEQLAIILRDKKYTYTEHNLATLPKMVKLAESYFSIFMIHELLLYKLSLKDCKKLDTDLANLPLTKFNAK